MNNSTSIWFNEKCFMFEPLPKKCIFEIAKDNRNVKLIDMWIEKLGLDKKIRKEQAINYIASFGDDHRDDLEWLYEYQLAFLMLRYLCRDLEKTSFFLWDYRRMDKLMDGLQAITDIEGMPEDWSEETWNKFQKAMFDKKMLSHN